VLHEKEIRTARAAPLVASKRQTGPAKLVDRKESKREAKTSKAKEKEEAPWQSETIIICVEAAADGGEVLELDGAGALIGRATSGASQATLEGTDKEIEEQPG
jgi:alpha-D-ribose 1-methylphosphonate 5-triphosphate synthase subunit PhnH